MTSRDSLGFIATTCMAERRLATIRIISREKGFGGRWIGRLRSSLRASLRRDRTLQVVKASFVFASCYGDNSRLWNDLGYFALRETARSLRNSLAQCKTLAATDVKHPYWIERGRIRSFKFHVRHMPSRLFQSVCPSVTLHGTVWKEMNISSLLRVSCKRDAILHCPPLGLLHLAINHPQEVTLSLLNFASSVYFRKSEIPQIWFHKL